MFLERAGGVPQTRFSSMKKGLDARPPWRTPWGHPPDVPIRSRRIGAGTSLSPGSTPTGSLLPHLLFMGT
ncbi:hypothetical protein [Nitrosococcus halophilus]|uniref:hypothetical protein n=1 Tax=Nitrosococcus halophilus TaxID=133539 RepID=UPI0002DE1556|nr:hypothetical protein [Nitrosococcus halophilus]